MNYSDIFQSRKLMFSSTDIRLLIVMWLWPLHLMMWKGPCTGNQQSLAHSRLWDAVVGFLHVFAHMQMKLSQVSYDHRVWRTYELLGLRCWSWNSKESSLWPLLHVIRLPIFPRVSTIMSDSWKSDKGKNTKSLTMPQGGSSKNTLFNLTGSC